ncbi:MAG: OmpA family protein [Deltaproteobacteria bacterium]|nr:OmpA family protein [Deltaproteobacteria bacterium]
MAVICMRARASAPLVVFLLVSCGAHPPGPAPEEPGLTATPPESPPVFQAAPEPPAAGAASPEPDTDQDAILDADDQCPNEPETYNGTEDEDGCPDNLKVVVISCPHPTPVTRVYFEKNSAKVKKTSEAILMEVVQVLEDNPQILRVQVAGHAFMEGKKAKAIALSKKRAEAVVSFLEDGGVAPGILSVAGYGALCPHAQGKDKQAQQKNRNAQFFLLETEEGCVDVDFACQVAVDQGLVPPGDEKYLPESDYCQELKESPSP